MHAQLSVPFIDKLPRSNKPWEVQSTTCLRTAIVRLISSPRLKSCLLSKSARFSGSQRFCDAALLRAAELARPGLRVRLLSPRALEGDTDFERKGDFFFAAPPMVSRVCIGALARELLEREAPIKAAREFIRADVVAILRCLVASSA
eukprot:1137840-Rhodomonas_salina.1